MNNKLILLLILLVFLNFSSQTESSDHLSLDSVIIYSVSTDIETLNYYPYGSIEGGTYVYIKATGLDQTASNNAVSIGPYECKIPESGINEVYLTCITEPAIYTTQRTSLKVSIFVKDKATSTCGISSCLFTYTDSYTPELTSIIGRAQAPNEDISFYGVWRVSTTTDITNLEVGDLVCNLMDIESPSDLSVLEYDTTLSASDRQLVTCTLADDLVAGYKTFDTSTIWGYPRELRSTWGMSADGQNTYQVLVIPEIDELSSNTGSTYGQKLTITGSGFGDDSSVVEVSIGDEECSITSIGQNEIICDIAAGTIETSSSEVYHDGLGWEYYKFSLSGVSGVSDYSTLRKKIYNDFDTLSEYIMESGFVNEIERVDTESQVSGYWFKGYFKAPRSGNYKFSLSTDDSGGIYMDKTPNEIVTSNLKLIYSTGYKPYRMYAYYKTDKMASDAITLVGGELYYMEVVAYNSGGYGSVTFSVEVPNDDETFTPMITVPETQWVSLDYTPIYEQWSIKVWNTSTAFAILFKYTDASTKTVVYSRGTEEHAWDGWTDSNFRNWIDYAAGYYGTTLTSAYLDCKGNVLANQSDTASRNGKQWNITFTLYRSGYMKITPIIQDYVITVGKYSISQLQDASDHIDGTYTLSLDGTLLNVDFSDGTSGSNIPYNTEPYRIRNALWKLLGNDDEARNIEYWYSGRYVDGIKYAFNFKGMNAQGDISTLVADYSGLTGINPTVTVTTLRNGSLNYFYEPVSGDMLVHPASTPSVIVKVNGIESACLADDCSYETSTTSNYYISSFSYTSSSKLLSMVTSLSSVSSFNRKKLTITFGGLSCTPLSSTTAALVKCTLSGQPIAGTYKPKVYYEKLGYLLQPDTSLTFSLTATSLSITTMGAYGGKKVTLTGAGFPYAASSDFNIYFGSAKVTNYVSVANTAVSFYIPVCDSADCDLTNAGPTFSVTVKVTYKDLSATVAKAFTYTATGVPEITGLSVHSASPVVKQEITISGANFGSSTSDLQIYMDTETTKGVYELSAVSVEDTSIVAILPGGTLGTYYIRVSTESYGDSYPANTGDNKIVYEILITSVTPQVGSILGGTTVSIKGKNFCTSTTDNTVFITRGINYSIEATILKVIKGATTDDEDEIIVVLPTPTEDFQVADGEYYADIVVQGKLLEESTCPNDNCGFTFSTQYTANYTAPTITALYNGDIITIEAYGLVGTVQLYVGTEEAIVEYNSTQINFTVPNIVAGIYAITILDDNGIVEGNYDYTINVTYALIGCSPSSSSYGGQEITISASGLDPDLVTSVTIGSKGTCLISSITSNQIVCRTPSSTSAGYQNIVYAQSGSSSLTLSSKFYYNSSNTASATIAAYNSSQINITSSTLSVSLLSAYVELSNTLYRIYSSSIYNTTTTNIVLDFFTFIRPGTYKLYVYQTGKGYAYIATQTISIALPTLSASSATSSLAGGQSMAVTVSGNPAFNTENTTLDKVTVCGFPATVTSVSDNSLTFKTPYVQTEILLDTYKQGDTPVEITSDLYTLFGSISTQSVLKLINDDKVTTYFYQNNAATCYVGYDLGAQLQVGISKITYTPRFTATLSKYVGLQIQGNVGDDDTAWEVLYTIDSRIHYAENMWKPDSKNRDALSKGYRRIRLYNYDASTSAANCEMAEFKVYGVVYTKTEQVSIDDDLVCDVNVTVNNLLQTFTSLVTYKNSLTPIIEAFQPDYGLKTGGETIKIVGQHFGTSASDISVLIDGVACTVTAVTSVQITCVTGDKYAYCESNSNCEQQTVEVTIKGNKAVKDESVKFYYGLRYSLTDTWGGEAIPRDGDSIYVPSDEVLIVDQSTNQLYSVIVEGILLFSNEVDMTFDTNYLIIRNGSLIIGQEDNPYQCNLVITLHGSYEDTQLPEFGNKVIGCHHCTIDIHGLPKTPAWTELDTTIYPDDTFLTLKETVENWNVGDEIVIASTSFDPDEAEVVTIESIITCDSIKTCVTFSPALVYEHVGSDDIYTLSDGNVWSVPRRAEVAILTRNVIIQGDSDSEDTEYGAHLMLHGKGSEGTIGRIEHAVFRYVGQPDIDGRYPINFHLNGDVHESYVIGAVVRDSYARVIDLQGVSYMLVEQCVGYQAKGHNFLLQDGIEQYNYIVDSLSLNAKQTYNMLQTDITVAGFWITNPLNYIEGNHAAGSDFYGIWWELKYRPDGPSATNDVCPRGDIFGSLTNSDSNWNVGHSCRRFGLRIYQYAQRTYPCKTIINPTATGADYWSSNPTIQTYISNFYAWKNGQSGVSVEDMGNTVFDNFILTDNYHTGFEARLSNITNESLILENSLIVGISTGYSEDELAIYQSANSIGLSTPRTDGFIAKNITMRNFLYNMTLIEMASQNQYSSLRTQGGKQLTVESLDIDDSCSAAKKVLWEGPRANIIYDKGGSLSELGQDAYITPYNSHFTDVAECQIHLTTTDDPDNLWDSSVVCSSGIQLRALILRNFITLSDFQYGQIKILNLYEDEISDFLPEGQVEDVSTFGTYTMYPIYNKPYYDQLNAFAAVFATNYVYNVHFSTGIDFTHMLLVPTIETESTDKPYIIRFNYSETRETFDMVNWIAGKASSLLYQHPSLDSLMGKDDNGYYTCSFGDYYHNADSKTLSICISGINRNTSYNSIDVSGIYCRDTCPKVGLSCTREVGLVRKWSDTTLWTQNETFYDEDTDSYVLGTGLPSSTDQVLIPCEWSMTLDVSYVKVKSLTIDGILRIDSSLSSVTIEADYIWVRGGSLYAGDYNFPFTGKLTIKLTGTAESTQLVIDDTAGAGTKMLAITGDVKLYGVAPTNTFTRLAQSASAGDTVIKVVDDISDWSVGDQIVLGPTEMTYSEYEKATIASISGQSITLTSALSYFHYGSSKRTISSSDSTAYLKIDSKFSGQLDMRGTVGHITRNIKIIGSNEGNLGGSILVYHWILKDNLNDVNARGSFVLYGVELENMGQKDTEKAGIRMIYTNDDGDDTVLASSSIHDCNGQCMNIMYADHGIVNYTVFYNGSKYLFDGNYLDDWDISSNLFIGANIRSDYSSSYWDPVGLLIIGLDSYDPSEDTLTVQYNIGQGSGGLGFSFPAVPLSLIDSQGIKYNEVGVVKLVGVTQSGSKDLSWWGGLVSVYHSYVGYAPSIAKTTQEAGLTLSYIIAAECKKAGIVMRVGNGFAQYSSHFLKYSWVGAVIRQDCTGCYAQTTASQNPGSNNIGLQLNYITQSAKAAYPIGTSPSEYDDITTSTAPFQATYLSDITFYQFKSAYTGYTLCTNNVMMTINPGASEDYISPHYLTKVIASSSETNQMFRFLDPNEDYIGYYGGCGDFSCTGRKNVLIQDMDGSLFGTIAAATSYNSDVEFKLSYCTNIVSWNGFYCTGNTLGMLEFMNTGDDRQTVLNSPVVVEGPTFSNTLNMWKEWEWTGTEPLGMRENNFVSIVELNKYYTIDYSHFPGESLYRISPKVYQTGVPSSYVIIQLSTSSALSVQVQISGKYTTYSSNSGKYGTGSIVHYTYSDYEVKKSVLLSDQDATDLTTLSSECGANKYFYQNKTTIFLLNGNYNCNVRIALTNMVQVNLRLAVTVEEFYNEDVQTSFINRISAYLGISANRIKIVGLKSSSSRLRRLLSDDTAETTVIFEIQSETTISESKNDTYSAYSEYVTFQNISQQLDQGLSNSSLDLEYSVISYEDEITVAKSTEDTASLYTESDYLQETNTIKIVPIDSQLTITFGVFFGLAGSGIIAYIVYNIWKKKQIELFKQQKLKEGKLDPVKDQSRIQLKVPQESETERFREDPRKSKRPLRSD